MHFRTHTRSFPFERPFQTQGWTLHSRDVIYVELDDGQALVHGFGEAAPMPAFGTETLEDARELLACTTNGTLPLLGASRRLYPALSYALECAQLDFNARSADLSLAAFLGGEQRQVPINAVIAGGSPQEAREATLRAVDQGYSCMKLKIGMRDLADDLAMCDAVRGAAGEGVGLRLDANGAWNLRQAIVACSALEDYQPEYIEQPLAPADWEHFADLRSRVSVPVAADESAVDLRHARRLLDEDAVDVFVIKPMAAGSLLACRDFALDAAGAGRKVVFTTLLESALGRSAVAQLCASLPGDTVHGLGTGGFFAEDVARDIIRDGNFILPDAPGIGIDPLQRARR